MARHCSYCTKPLLLPDGSVDYRRRFYDRACANADNRERKQAVRTKVPGKRCSKCGQVMRQNAPVSHDNGLREAQRKAG
jgi:hypothetical protein